jgi:diguanylate cyclase (GGDEF)-like protein
MPKKPVILITDDIKANRLIIRKLLKPVGAEIVEAESGEEALKMAAKSDRVALILLDVQMPGMDGYQVAELLREKEQSSHIPIMFITGIHRDKACTRRGYGLGAVDYLYKPVEPDILISKVGVFLDLWHQRNELEREIERRADSEAKVHHMAHHDLLTNLPNRRQLYANLEQEMQRCDRYGKKLALLFLDLDGFKDINDSVGHHIGDQILITIADRYQKLIRGTDTLARFGGDEFVILLTDITDKELLVNKLTNLVQTTHQSMEIEGNHVFLGVSIGVAYYPDHADNLEQLVRNADKAMFMAKREGRNTFRFYFHEMDRVFNQPAPVDTRSLPTAHLN